MSLSDRQFVVVCQRDIPAGHPMLDEESTIPRGPLVMEQYLGKHATLDAIARRANALSASGYETEVWRVVRPADLRRLIVGALVLGTAFGLVAGAALFALFS